MMIHFINKGEQEARLTVDINVILLIITNTLLNQKGIKELVYGTGRKK